MIALHRPTSSTSPVIRVLGVGGAAGSVLDRLVLDGADGASLIALNTDVQALNGCVAPHKLQLGRGATRGLGAGGDPEVGYQAAEESADDIRAAIEGADIVFLLAGLGGGTGSGAAPLIAHMARGTGALVVAFATMPFTFEGKRRLQQAAESLAQLREQADLLVCFENDRLGEASSHKAGVQDAFVAADQLLSQSITAIGALVRRGGIIPTGLDSLAAALRRRDSRCLFGHGESDSANRVHDALARALKSPLMDRGRLLADCHSVIVHVAGGPDLTVQEVTSLMEEFGKHIGDDTRIDFGLSTDPKLGHHVAVTIISSLGAVEAAETRTPARTPQRATSRPSAPPRTAPAETHAAPARSHGGEEDDIHPAHTAASAGHTHPQADGPEFDLGDEPGPEPAPAPAVTRPAHATTTRRLPAEKAPAPAKKEEKAEQLALEPANRGRFEKSEPTIVDGQDLDVPTFLRKNVKVK